MSIWDFIFDSEYQQRSDIESLKSKSRAQSRISLRRSREEHRKFNKVKDRMTALKNRVGELEEQVGALELMNRTLMAVLRESPNWDEDRFRSALHDIDLEDGKLDGKVSK